MRYGWQLRLWVPFYNTCVCRKTWWWFFLLAWCAVFVPSHTNGVAKCQKSDVNNFYIRLRAKNTALITSMMLNNLELLTSETQNQRSACNVLRNLHFLSFSPLANTESWERFFLWTDLLHPPASLHWQRGAEFDFKSTYGQQGHWKDRLGLKESPTWRKFPKTSDIALSFCREYLPERW